jgi:hypothetical protein
MLFSSMRHLPVYSSLSKPGHLAPIPTIKELQALLELAWAAGYDPKGRKHYNGKIAGSRKWIGTTEIYTAFTYLGVSTKIYDFEASKDTQNQILKWVRAYFRDEQDGKLDKSMGAINVLMASNGGRCSQGSRQPLLLQHRGHSRVIIGIEDGAKETSLLVFDPSRCVCSYRDIQADSLTRHTKSAVRKAAEAMTRGDAEPAAKRVRLDSSASSSKSKLSSLVHHFKSSKLDLAKHADLLSVYRVNIKNLRRHTEYQVCFVLAVGEVDAEFRSSALTRTDRC